MRSRNVTICLMAAVLVMATGQGFGTTQFKDGGTHNINYTINDVDVWVDYQAPGMQTTVNLLNGGYISGELDTYQDSRTNITGGYVGNQLYAFDSSHVTISGGSAGGVMSNLYALDNSQVTMSGGSVGGYLQAWDSSQVTISGGSVLGNLEAAFNGQMTIVGSNFAIDGTPFGFGEITGRGDSLRRLTGILANGDIINSQFHIGEGASIVLTPEPATLFLLGLGAVMLRNRR